MADDAGRDERDEGERTRDEHAEDERWEAEARSTGPRENTDDVTQADAGLQGAEGTARSTGESPVEPRRNAEETPEEGEEEEEGDDERDREPS